MGYYLDAKQHAGPQFLSAEDPETLPSVGQKRKFVLGDSADLLDETDPEAIDAYITNAEKNASVVILTAESLQQVKYRN